MSAIVEMPRAGHRGSEATLEVAGCPVTVKIYALSCRGLRRGRGL